MMNRELFTAGGSSILQFFWWINERHGIYLRRAAGQAKPWTNDPILQEYKFTNAFRELDRGTVALRKMEREAVSDYAQESTLAKAALLMWNAWQYRLWNLDIHAELLGYTTMPKLRAYMQNRQFTSQRIFTGAHMVAGVAGESKVWPYLRLAQEVWERREELATRIINVGTIRGAFDIVRELFLMGDFTSYEVVCDLRWTILQHATDKLTWANIGNGANRGLRRLGLPPKVDSMIWLYQQAKEHLAGHVLLHYGEGGTYPPFELREIEHSLCEFDKYERTRTGLGKPRSKYDGRS